MQAGKKIIKTVFFLPALAGLILPALVLFHVQTVQAASVQIKGIDVSRWQGTINWEKVKEDGIEFAMLGTGRYKNGVAIEDPMFEYNITNAIENDIKVGIYLYSEALTVEEARAEARYVLEQMDGYKISYPVAFDIEDASQKALTNAARTDIAIAFLEVIEEAGYYPMLYASESWLNESMDLTRLTKYDKWVANWSSGTSFRPLSMWQYSSTGKVEGISANVDLDYAYKDYSKIITPRTKANAVKTKTGWNTDGTNYWYVQSDGSIYKNTLKTINGKKYYFDSNGYRVTGWRRLGKKYYFFNRKTGAMRKGWLTVDGKKYYLDSETGVRQSGWVTIDGARYYFKSNGVQKTGWLTINGKKYFLNLKTGKMRTGWLTYQGKTYFFNRKTGVMRTGWFTFSGKRYYMDKNGCRVSGWQKIDGKWYFFGPKTGAMQKNMKIGKYKIGKDGVCANRED